MKKTLIFLSILVLILINITTKEEVYVVPNESVRLRILANSNSVYDQYIKNEVKKSLEEELKNTMEESTSIEKARIVIQNNIEKYEKKVKETLDKYNYDKTFTINYGNNYFPVKEYKGVKYEEGEYESLLITLGEGKGDNWWCVLYPPICTLEVEEADDVEYKFFIKEIIEKYLK